MHAIANQPVAQICTPCPALITFQVRVADRDGDVHIYKALSRSSWDAADDAMTRFPDANFIDVKPAGGQKNATP